MTTSSEDVLLSVNHVRYKKGDGTLYLMNQRIAWMVEHRDTVAVSHKYADIKTQKISPVGKPKVQLQVVLHDGGCSTFHFVNPAGPEAQAQDRDQVKARLLSLLPLFRRQVNRELEEKSRLLSLHPTLKHLYEDLVITKVLSSEEYWNTPTIKQYTENQTEKQEIGVSGAFLADIKPQTDGCNGLKYNLTQDIIESVFKTYPAVRKKHSDYVPNKMTESEFWTKFFQSHYFHRDRIATSSKDLFTECGRLDDQQLNAAAMAAVAETSELDMGRWNEPDPLQEDAPVVDNSSTKASQGQVASVHHNMIKRFNQHSILVLKAGENASPSKSNEDGIKNGETSQVNGNGPSPEKREVENSNGSSNSSAQPNNKRKRILEKIQFDDLKSDEGHKETPQLELSKVERYLYGPNSSSGAVSPPATSGSSVRQAARAARSLALGWAASGVSGQAGAQRPLQPLPQAIVGALGELSPGGALMRHHNTTSLAQLVPQDVESEARRLYLGAGELLRAFWHCFPSAHLCQPPASAETISKAHEALIRFKHAKVKPFEDKMVRELSPLAHSLTKHLSVLFQSASARYTLWQSRQAKMKSRALEPSHYNPGVNN